jgi:hypothetical protein
LVKAEQEDPLAIVSQTTTP